MVIVEDITEEDERMGCSLEELLLDIQDLSKRLVVPSSLLPDFMKQIGGEVEVQEYLQRTLETLGQLSFKIKEVDRDWGWEQVSAERCAELLQNIVRLYGEDQWTSPIICQHIEDLSLHFPSILPLALLSTLRPYFAPHPNLSSASRAALRPTGGKESIMDLHESQPFKSAMAWGVHNILSWSASKLKSQDVEKHIGLLLPPTLVMMDDWEPAWREIGAVALEKWVLKLNPEALKRMGLEKLLLKSLLHTLTLHPSPPLRKVLPITLKTLQHAIPEGRERTIVYSEVIENKFIQGWTYAPSGLEGREVLINIAEELQVMCDIMGVGIVRWFKTIIPCLLDPLQYIPTPVVIPHYIANLKALLCLMQMTRSTGRISRWRGQMINILARLFVQNQERKGIEDPKEAALLKPIESLIRRVFEELSDQVPSVKQEEFIHLLSITNNDFGGLIGSTII
ncbi:hypothetical protein L204_106390 [Cryptococcus depauperatus]|nr:hypothetical protein L204_06218 [Cryptococcus depauperatus CBS 7855]